MKPFTFDPHPSLSSALFAAWVPMYVAQATMDDEEAEPLQDALCKLETAIHDQPMTTLQDFFVNHTTLTCFGSMAADYSQEQRDAIHAAAMAAMKECDEVLALIAQHIENEGKFCALLDEYDDDTPEYAAIGGEELSDRGLKLIKAIASYPAASFDAIMLKGRYLAARRAHGGLAYEDAFLFVESFLDKWEGV